MNQNLTRRNFLSTAGTATIGVAATNSLAADSTSAGNRLRILGIACSPRKGKTTAKAVQAALDAAKSVDSRIEVELIDLGGLNIAGYSPTLPQDEFTGLPITAPPAVVASEKVADTTQIIAYYFHGTVRCETCLRIEKQAQELIGSRFASQVLFRSVNYDELDNAHFSNDFKLPCPSLVLVRQKNGKDQNWRLLGQTWDHVQIPPKLDQYIEEETTKFLAQ